MHLELLHMGVPGILLNNLPLVVLTQISVPRTWRSLPCERLFPPFPSSLSQRRPRNTFKTRSKVRRSGSWAARINGRALEDDACQGVCTVNVLYTHFSEALRMKDPVVLRGSFNRPNM